MQNKMISLKNEMKLKRKDTKNKNKIKIKGSGSPRPKAYFIFKNKKNKKLSGRGLPLPSCLAHDHMVTLSLSVKMADQTWKKLSDKIKAKRTKKPAMTETNKKIKGEELIVQRLSAEVSGKAQKYSRIGPREFVPFDSEEELSIDNIKSACEKHFFPQLGRGLKCDVLAGEQGPSCKSTDQIPSMNVIYVRFISMIKEEDDSPVLVFDDRDSENRLFKKPKATQSLSSNPQGSSSPSKFVPLSLSVTDMIKLGKLDGGPGTSTQKFKHTVVNLYQFDLELMTWSKVPIIVEFKEEKEPFGSGGFRAAYIATTKHPNFKDSTWVIKRYLAKAKENIASTNQTTEQHTRKTVQMHYLARNFASQLEQKVMEQHADSDFGKVPRYRKIFYGEDDNKECVTVEEFISGKFIKYMNNNGDICVDKTDLIGLKAECLSHFSYEKSNHKLMLVDVQGSGYNFFDPEIASDDLFDEKEEM
ncbi:Eukaryotic elongation factor 2 kinase, partial [Exaiptasia diaphana]